MSAAASLGSTRLDAVEKRLRQLVRGEVKVAEPLAPWTSLRVGGSAEFWIRPKSGEDLQAAQAFAHQEGLPVWTLGGGANTLVGDGGVEGLVFKLPSDAFPEEVTGEGLITLGAGAAIARLVTLMKANGWVGAEFLAGIPGTLGGAVTMNAGTKMGECLSVVDAIELSTPEGLGWVSRGELSYRYRHTDLPRGSVVTRVRFLLQRGNLAESIAKMEADLSYRKSTQPLNQPNCGSVFQNPPGHHAGRLIEEVGLKGHTVGGAQISSRHANWIVNLGGARAADVVALMDLAQSRVLQQTGISLVPEVQRVGRFS